MQQINVQDETFERNDFTEKPLAKGQYENCVFSNCDFSDCELNEFKFIECEFRNSNLSLIKLNQTALQDVKFIHCKMLGVRFDMCLDFGLSFTFDTCQLSHCIFYGKSIKKTSFLNSQLKEVDFTKCELSGSIFENCELSGAVFENTILEKADFRSSYNYSIDPELNRIKKAKFSILGISGLLEKYDIVIEPIHQNNN